VKIEAIDGMTCHVNRLHPKAVRSLLFINHGSCHLYESLIHHFSHPILLRSVGDQKLMLDAFFIKKVFYLCILELDVIVTSYLLNLGIKLILIPSQELLEHLLHFTFILQEERPSETRIIINIDTTIFDTGDGYLILTMLM
jgi:hypothetical protein